MRYKRPEERLWSLAFGAVFSGWGVLAWLKPGFPGSPWIAFAGIVLIADFLVTLRQSAAVKRIVLGALKSYGGERVPLARLTAETGVGEKDLRKALADLRGEGRVSYRLDEEAKELLVSKV